MSLKPLSLGILPVMFKRGATLRILIPISLFAEYILGKRIASIVLNLVRLFRVDGSVVGGAAVAPGESTALSSAACSISDVSSETPLGSVLVRGIGASRAFCSCLYFWCVDTLELPMFVTQATF
jgi:hypothetical protein